MEQLPKAFDPTLIEEKWRISWESKKCFTADSTSTKPAYCLVMPPPNVTGVLHMGHALVNTLQDVLIRWKRMLGFETLWVPGTDHAGIATQTVVERHLIAKTGKRRVDFSREEFLSHVWDWKEKSEHQILSQLKKLGCSCDWSRLCFTMDEPRNRAVKAVFKKLFDTGLIYRGDYLVNWDCITQTALADDEVEYEERDSFLWHFRYPLQEDPSQFIVIATTRPETMLGDVGVAVSPEDNRYKNLIGKTILLPLQNRPIPIFADHRVDKEFGTGAVKVTPAHDLCDYEMALTHHLPLINIMTPEGKVNENGGHFAGLTFAEARQAVVGEMQKLGLVDKIVPYIHRVGVSYRSKAVIEPYLSKQWFVKMDAFKTSLRRIVEEKQVKLIPESWENTYFHWIDNLRDWCISRQLWWGHRIPIWYHESGKILCYEKEGIPPEVAADPNSWSQDEDVLDTWFSSALWPFSTLGWPEKTVDLDKFYPNSCLVTGHDILFFWVARMILMGSYVLDKPPFPETFLHGLIYGKSYWKEQKGGSVSYITGQERVAYDLGETLPSDVRFKWEKMSKSKGNIIDPLEIIDSYGTDAMRMALCASATQARQIDLDRRKFEEFKNFANKVWNGARFVFMNLESLSPSSFEQGIQIDLLSLEDRWILSLLNTTVLKVHTYLSEYNFDKAALCAYDFFWKDFCAYYVELAKPILFEKVGSSQQKENKQKLLANILVTALRLLHPMAPFITEELFSLLKEKFNTSSLQPSADIYTQATIEALQADFCSHSPYPTALQNPENEIEGVFSFLDAVVRTIRSIRAEMQLPPSSGTDVWVVGVNDTWMDQVKEHALILTSLVKIDSLHFVLERPQVGLCAESNVETLTVIVPLPEVFKEKEKVRMKKELERLLAQQNSLLQKLALPDFTQKAPPHVVEALQKQLEQTKAQALKLENKLQEL